MSTARMIGRGIAWNTVGAGAGKIVAFVNIFLILHNLSVYEYGLSELIFSVIATLNIILLPGLSTAITADLAVERARGEFGRMKAIFLRYFAVSGVLSLVAWGVLFFGSSTAAHMAGNDSIGYFLQIVSFLFLLSPLRGMAQMLATIEGRFFDMSFYGVIEETAKCILLVLFFYGLHHSIDGLLYATVLAQLVAFLLFVPRTLSAYRLFGHATAEDGQVFWQLLRDHRKWSVAVSYINNLGKTLQLWVIRLLLGTEAVGLYAFAMGVIGQLASFLPLNTILVSVLPRFIDRRDELIRIFKASLKGQIAVSCVLLLCGYIGTPLLLWVFPKYSAVLPLLNIMLLSIIPVCIVGLYSPMFNTLKGQFQYFISMIWKTIFLFAFLWFGIFAFGLEGIAVGVVLGFTASAIERTIRIKKLLPELTLSQADFRLSGVEIDFLKKCLLEMRVKGVTSFLR